MYKSQQTWVDLDHSLLRDQGADVYVSQLESWVLQHVDECNFLAEFRARTDSDWQSASDEDLCRLYAIFRVTSLLLLRFQRGRADGTDYPGPTISLTGYQLFHRALGFREPSAPTFHPFFHEIIGVHATSRSDVPIEIVEQIWPPLMLGSMMFCRAGCIVSGGADHIDKELAEQSKLYWTYRRKDRRCNDQSHGWGSNSQWRTRLRRDYQTQTGFHFNVDAPEDLNKTDGTVDGMDGAAMIELVRNRCLIKSRIDDSDLYPYRYSYAERA